MAHPKQAPLDDRGFDAVLDDAGAELQAFVETFKVPVIQTYKAKGILPEDHPLALAPAALSPVADQKLLPLVESADLVLLAGYDAIEMRTSWQNPWDCETKRVIDIGRVHNDHYMHQAGLNFVADVGASLRTLGMDVAPSSSWSIDEVADWRKQIKALYREDEEWGPAAITSVAREVLPRSSIASVDAGAHRILLSQVWDCYEPSTLLQSNGLCTMGGAIPLAIGAKIAEPERLSVAFLGDGGILMFLGELATCAEVELPVIIVLFVDRSLALIEKKQRESQLKKSGVDLGHFDYASIARGLGGNGVIVSSRAELSSNLQAALKADRFTLIACEFEENAYDGRI